MKIKIDGNMRDIKYILEINEFLDCGMGYASYLIRCKSLKDMKKEIKEHKRHKKCMRDSKLLKYNINFKINIYKLDKSNKIGNLLK